MGSNGDNIFQHIVVCNIRKLQKKRKKKTASSETEKIKSTQKGKKLYMLCSFFFNKTFAAAHPVICSSRSERLFLDLWRVCQSYKQ